MKYPVVCKNIIDVTKPPYNADNTGRTDCTKVLRQVLDDVLIREVEGVEESRKRLIEMGTNNVYRGFENRLHLGGKINVLYPEVVPPSRIIYFPAGVYLVSDTVSYTLENLRNIYYSEYMSELCRGIHIMGEDAESVTIKLADNSEGFEKDSKKPLLSLNTREEACIKATTNVAQMNTVEDLTLDCGKGNDGAVGLRFCSNNSGRIENVNIISEKGYAGIQTACKAEATVTNVKCCGFDYGMDVPQSSIMVVDGADFSGCNIAGIYTYSSIMTILKLDSGNNPHLIFGDGEGVYYADEKCSSYEGELNGNKLYKEVECAWLRNMKIPKNIRSCNPDDWVCVDDFGAVGDGVTDSTLAIQKAMNSGKPIIIFGEGHYLIDGKIKIPATVKTVDFMFCDLFAGRPLVGGEIDGVFDICEDSEDILFMENLYTFEQFCGHMRCVKHSAKRDLVLSDFHNQASASYFNTVEGSKVYMDNCASTIGTYTLNCVLDREGYIPVYAHMIPYEFHGQTVYGRQVNPERADIEVLNDNSQIMFDGFKVEGPGVAVKTVNCGRTQVNGACCGIGYKHATNGLWETEDSDVLLQGVFLRVFHERLDFNIVIKQTTNGVQKLVHKTELADKTGEFNRRLNYYCSKDITQTQ